MVKVAIVAAILGAITLAVMIRSIVGQSRVSCEVCVTFQSGTECRTALGATREEAVRTATDNACALLASGMTDSIRCTNTQPDRVTCEP